MVHSLASLLPKHTGAIIIRTLGLRQCGWYLIVVQDINIHYKRLQDFIEATAVQLANLEYQTSLIRALRQAVNKVLIQLYHIGQWVEQVNNDIEPATYNDAEPAIITLTGRLLEELEEPLPAFVAVSDTHTPYSDYIVLESLPHPLGGVY